MKIVELHAVFNCSENSKSWKTPKKRLSDVGVDSVDTSEQAGVEKGRGGSGIRLSRLERCSCEWQMWMARTWGCTTGSDFVSRVTVGARIHAGRTRFTITKFVTVHWQAPGPSRKAKSFSARNRFLKKLFRDNLSNFISTSPYFYCC